MHSAQFFLLNLLVLPVGVQELYNNDEHKFSIIRDDIQENFDCNQRHYGFDSFVCVCDPDHCDPMPTLKLDHPDKEALVLTTSRSGARFKQSVLKWKPPGNRDTESLDTTETITFDASKRFQTIDGFGGAFTDSTGINIASLPLKARDRLMKAYFSQDGGIGYSIGRIPIASCDFSTRNYSYNDEPDDFDLQHFSLATDDHDFKIPFIKQAFNLSNGHLKLFATPWAPPAWMKTNKMMQGGGTLIGEPGGKYYKTWAKYLTKFIDEYEKLGVNIWALSVENEPNMGWIKNYSFQALGFTPEMMRDFIKMDLLPALVDAGRPDMKLFILDDNRNWVENWTNVLLGDEQVRKYVSHIALHWYSNPEYDVTIVDRVHEKFPETPILATEACAGWREHTVELGNWKRAEYYAFDIITDLNHWYTGWIDWNMVLDLQGGPNWVGNFVDCPVIVNATAGEFYKQPMFYILGHFSAFLPRGSFRVNVERIQNANPNILVTGFIRPDRKSVLILMNQGDSNFKVTLFEPAQGAYPARSLKIKLEKHSIASVLFSRMSSL